MCRPWRRWLANWCYLLPFAAPYIKYVYVVGCASKPNTCRTYAQSYIATNLFNVALGLFAVPDAAGPGEAGAVPSGFF